MPLRQLAALEHLQDILRQLEQPHAVRHRRLRLPDLLGEVAERQAELVEHGGEGARLLDGRQIFAGDVLDQAEQQRVAVVGLAHHRRQ